VDSTNTYVREHFDELPDLALVTAVHQTAGRGRLGRKWIAPPGVNLSGTFCFKSVTDGFHAGMICGVALMETVKTLLPESDFYLKWPNDLYYGKKKVAGMLGEGVLKNGRIAGIAMGIGLNVNTSEKDLLGAGQPAASLKLISGREFNPDFVARLLAKYVNVCYIRYSNSVNEIFDLWRSANKLIGRNIAVTDACGVRYEGIFRDVSPAGEMILEIRDDTGVRKRCFNCGDVSVDKSTI
jgi:BirA family biotin operon repressor/biotin-[acetyl-CoA-carboxylase] ligase